MQKKALLTTAIIATAAFPAVSMAGWSANVGWVSEYIYRGVFQNESSASGGLDYESDSGFYAGIWGADVDLGLEYDLYAGYGGSIGDSGGYSIGFTGYFYTEDGSQDGPNPGFYDTITEVNLGVSFDIFSIDLAIGEDEFVPMGGDPNSSTDYTFLSIGVAPEVGPYYSFNTFGDDLDGSYLELGYDFSAMDLDFNVTFLYGLDIGDSDNAVLLSPAGYADTALVFGVSKGFTLGE